MIMLMNNDIKVVRKQPKVIMPPERTKTLQLPSFESIEPENPRVNEISNSFNYQTLGASPNPAQNNPTFITPEYKQNQVTTLNHENPVKHRFLHFKWIRSKRFTIVSSVIIFILVAAGVATAYLAQPRGRGGGTFVSVQDKNHIPNKIPKVTTVPSNLSGRQVDAAVNSRPVTGVMIENSLDARPQSGIDQADIVFEAIAEGGITRFLALFQDNAPNYIGPVRSARPYYVQWCMSFDCALAHAGGSPEALQNIISWGTKDLNHNSSAFWRIDSRFAPHNLYSSMEKLNAYENSKGYGAAVFTPLTRKSDTASSAPNAVSVDINISSSRYNSHYDYDASTNSYRRSQGGAPHNVVNVDGAEAQINPKVVVVMIMQYGIAADKHSQYSTIGGGEAFVFQDGTMSKGQWHKADVKESLNLTDETGKKLALNVGQTWFVVVDKPEKIIYK